MQYKNLTIIGSSHVASESINKVKRTIENEKPGIVAVELDRDRLEALFNKKKRSVFIRGVGFKGALFAMFGAWIEKSIGKIVKVEPGSEMKMAVNMARKVDAKVALIDQHITITLRRFSETITWKEKWNFIIDIITGLFMPKKQQEMLGMKTQDLSKVPTQEAISKILHYTKNRYPNFYNVLVEERNKVMANNIANLMIKYPHEKIVAVVGAGHESEILKLVREKLYKHSASKRQYARITEKAFKILSK